MDLKSTFLQAKVLSLMWEHLAASRGGGELWAFSWPAKRGLSSDKARKHQGFGQQLLSYHSATPGLATPLPAHRGTSLKQKGQAEPLLPGTSFRGG